MRTAALTAQPEAIPLRERRRGTGLGMALRQDDQQRQFAGRDADL